MILEKINSPKDLKRLDQAELTALAGELRDEIIRVVSSTGGHLAPSLGVVELTIALHYVLNTPDDKIVWDVGHQCYAHKLLTGRRKDFERLRCNGGVCGFPSRKESLYDCFGTGHSSTSISAALGFSCARDLKNEDRRVVAVIGDGSMTGGMAFEALNNAGHLKKDLFVVLNDNEMFISKKVGALGEYLTRIMTSEPVHKVEEKIENILRKTPKIGSELSRFLHRSKAMLTPGMLFEEMGFNYFGPVDGHDLKTLVENIDRVSSMDGPRILHVITRKGKGYAPAEENPEKFHGTSEFDIDNGMPVSSSKKPSYQDVFGKAIVDLAERDEKIVAITAAMKSGTGLDMFAEKFPHRYFDVGIAEQHAVTFAAALAAEGLSPVCAIYSTFLQRAYDQIIHDVALQGLGVIFAVDRAGLVGEDGPTHHGMFDLSYLCSVPDMTVCAPCCSKELEEMIKAAPGWGGPVAVRYPRGQAHECPENNDFPIEKGKGIILKKGKDLTLAAIGSTVTGCIGAAEKLKEKGIKAEVINLRFAKPLDSGLLIESALKTGKIIIVEENTIEGGVGSRVRNIMPDGVKLRSIALKDEFVTYGPPDKLRKKYSLDAEGIYKKSLAFAGEK